MKVDAIYIIHYYKNNERKEYLDNFLKQKKFNTPIHFSSLYHRNSPEIHDSKYFDISEENRNKRNSITSQYGKVFEVGPGTETEVHRAYRAVTLEHYKTYENIFNNTLYENILFLEDDVRFHDNFDDLLTLFLQELPIDYDICYIGSGCNLQLPYQTNKILDIHPQYHSKCSDSYLITRKALQKIITTALPFFGAIDWELNYLQALNKLNVYWTTKPATYQGSQHGYYNSCFNII
jgi:hypothetical protein